MKRVLSLVLILCVWTISLHAQNTLTDKSAIQEMPEASEAITVIEADEIRGKAISLERLLNKAVGIKVRQSEGLSNNSQIRTHDLDGEQIMLFIDGQPANPVDGMFNIDDIPLHLIERIEIYRDIVPGRFGSSPSGEVVNIVVRDFETDYTDLSYERSSYNTNRASGVLKQNYEDHGISLGLSGFYNSSDNDYKFSPPYFGDDLTITRDHDKFNSYKVGLTTDFTKLWFDNIRLKFVHYGNEQEIQGIAQNIQHAETKHSFNIFEQQLEKKGLFSKHIDFKLNSFIRFGTTNFIDTANVDPYLDSMAKGEIGYWPNDSDDKIVEVRERINFLYEISPSHILNLNTDIHYADKRSSDDLANDFMGLNISNYTSDMLALTSSLTYKTKLFDNTFVNILSGKAFYLKTNSTPLNEVLFDFNISPKAISNSTTDFGFSEAFRWQALPFLNLNASYQHIYRVPTLEEFFGDGVLVDQSYDLNPEKIDHLNLRLKFDTPHFMGMERVQLEVAGFYQNVKNMINLKSGMYTRFYDNFHHIKVKGVEAELKIDFSNRFYGYINGTYRDIRDARKFVSNTPQVPNPTYDMEMPNFPTLFANFGFEYSAENLFGTGQFTKIYWDSQYTDEYKYDWEVSPHIDPTLPSTFIHDMGILHSFNHTYTIGFEIRNITDTDVRDHYNRQLVGRSYHLKFRYTLLEGR